MMYNIAYVLWCRIDKESHVQLACFGMQFILECIAKEDHIKYVSLEAIISASQYEW